MAAEGDVPARPAAARLILIRHGEPAWASPEGVATNDPALSERGRRQAEAVGARLAADPPDVLISSTMRRSVETAAAVATACGLEVRREEALREIVSPHWWEGSPVDEVEEVLASMRGRSLDAWWDGLPDGEGFRHFHERVTGGLEALLDELLGTRPIGEGEGSLWSVPSRPLSVALVTHAGTTSVALGHLLGIEPVPWEWERFASRHAAVSIVVAAPVGGEVLWSLRCFSDVSHLDWEEVTR